MIYWVVLVFLLLNSNVSCVSSSSLSKGMLKGKTALVTGSTSGIGLAIATSLAKEGANIVLNGLREDEESIKQIKALGVDTIFHQADMSKPDQIEDIMKTATERFGGVDILVNNAGIQYVSSVENFPVEKWDAIIAINLCSAFHTTRLAIPYMKQKNWGRIVNVASVHGLVASANKSAYVTAKHGLVGFTKSVALETANTGVTVNAICPGWVLTPLVQKQIDDRSRLDEVTPEQAKIALLSEKQPSAEFVTTEQLGSLTVFLCSSAGDQIRGVAWNVDGGWTAQ